MNLNLDYLDFNPAKKPQYQLSSAALVEKAICFGEGQLASNGALVVNTGEFTGRSPKDRFIVKDELTADTVHWGDINIPFAALNFDLLMKKMLKHLEKQN